MQQAPIPESRRRVQGLTIAWPMNHGAVEFLGENGGGWGVEHDVQRVYGVAVVWNRHQVGQVRRVPGREDDGGRGRGHGRRDEDDCEVAPAHPWHRLRSAPSHRSSSSRSC